MLLPCTEAVDVADAMIAAQLHIIVPLLNALKPQEVPLEFLFPRNGLIDTRPQRRDGFIE
jgi:hypothetical protein